MFIAPASSQATPSGLYPEGIDTADVVWTICATAMQLLLTPGRCLTEGGSQYSTIRRESVLHHKGGSLYSTIKMCLRIDQMIKQISGSPRHFHTFQFHTTPLGLLPPATAFFYAGLSHHKNVLSTILEGILTLIIISPLFAWIG